MTMDLDWRQFETDRLRLTPFVGSEAERTYATTAFNQKQVVQNLSRVPFPYGDSEFDSAAARVLAVPDKIFSWSIWRKSQPDTIVGAIGLSHEESDKTWRLGYSSLPEVWGQGLMSEAATAVVEFAFDVLKLASVHSAAFDDNIGSLKVLERSGFQIDGHGTATSLGRGDGIAIRNTKYKIDADQFHQHRMRDGCHSYTSIVHRQLPVITVAAAALVNAEGQILVAQRPEGKAMAGLWEFPGGKLEPGETPEAALIRELKEELGIDTNHSCLSPIAFASHSYPKFHLMMPIFAIRQWQGSINPMEGQKIQWLPPRSLWELPMPPADEPIIPLLIDLL